MSLFNRPRSSSQPLVRRISTVVRRRLSITMGSQRSSSPSAATPDEDTSSTSSIHALLDALSLKASSTSTSTSSDASTQSIDQKSQTNAVELHDDPIDEITLSPESHSTSPSSLSQPSPAFTFAVLDSPPTTPYSHPDPLLSHTIYTVYTPMPIEERLQRRQECIFRLHRLHQGLIQDPFGEWTDLAHGLYGGTIPPEFYLTSAPFTLHSLRGRVRLRYIRTAFCMPIDATVFQIESFLSRNPSIVRYLLFNVLPNPDHADRERYYNYEIHINHPTSRKYNSHLLGAIKQLDWIDETVDWVTELARTEDEKTLSTVYKVRKIDILPSVWKRMLETEEELKPKKMKKLHAKVAAQMQRDRPNSLLRNAVMPQDIVEESL